MADEAKGGVPIFVWIIVALIIGYLIVQKTTKAATAATGKLGEGIGKGAAETVIAKGSSALGSFLGGLFGGGSSKSGGAGAGGSSAAATDDDALSDDTSAFEAGHFGVDYDA